MGQYFLVVNLDKKQYLSPHSLADGAKLLELEKGTPVAFFVLASQGAPDLGSVAGRWAGDRIVVAGDWGEEEHLLPAAEVRAFRKKHPGEPANVYGVASALYKDVSFEVLEKLLAIDFVRELLGARVKKVLSFQADFSTQKDRRKIERVLAQLDKKRPGGRKAARRAPATKPRRASPTRGRN